MDSHTIFLLEAPRASAVAFLPRSAREFWETQSDWVRKNNVFNIKPLRGPFFGCLFRSARQVSCSAYAPYFGAAHLEYRSLLGARDEAEKFPP
jgi:hypothetical protein